MNMGVAVLWVMLAAARASPPPRPALQRVPAGAFEMGGGQPLPAALALPARPAGDYDEVGGRKAGRGSRKKNKEEEKRKGIRRKKRKEEEERRRRKRGKKRKARERRKEEEDEEANEKK